MFRGFSWSFWSRRAGSNRGPADYELSAKLNRRTPADVTNEFPPELVRQRSDCPPVFSRLGVRLGVRVAGNKSHPIGTPQRTLGVLLDVGEERRFLARRSRTCSLQGHCGPRSHCGRRQRRRAPATGCTSAACAGLFNGRALVARPGGGAAMAVRAVWMVTQGSLKLTRLALSAVSVNAAARKEPARP